MGEMAGSVYSRSDSMSLSFLLMLVVAELKGYDVVDWFLPGSFTSSGTYCELSDPSIFLDTARTDGGDETLNAAVPGQWIPDSSVEKKAKHEVVRMIDVYVQRFMDGLVLFRQSVSLFRQVSDG